MTPSIGEVYVKTARGVSAQVLRQLIAYPVALVFSVLLARALEPRDFGIFAVAQFLGLLAHRASKVELGASLVRQQAEPSDGELRSLFTLQLLLSMVAASGLWAGAPLLSPLFMGEPAGTSIVRVFAVEIVALSITMNSRVFLERRLAYSTVAGLELGEMLAYQGIALLLAWQHWGVWSLGLASLLSVAGRELLTYSLAPWPLGLGWDRDALRRHIRFGGALQFTASTALVRDSVATLVTGALLGPAAAGFLRWAQNLPAQVQQLPNGIVTSVAFPSLSRLAAHPEAAGRFLGRLLRVVNLATFGPLTLLAVLGPDLVRVLYTDRWAPALPALSAFVVYAAAAGMITPLDTYLQIRGRLRTSMTVASVWTALTLVGGAVGGVGFGVSGVAGAFAVAGWLTVAVLLAAVRRGCPLNITLILLRPLTCATVAGGAAWIVARWRVETVWGLAAEGMAGLLAYGVAVGLVERRSLIRECRETLRLVRGAWSPS